MLVVENFGIGGNRAASEPLYVVIENGFGVSHEVMIALMPIVFKISFELENERILACVLAIWMAPIESGQRDR